ncbi:TatD family hydrolase [Rubritalea spongiae]|uniref:TatD family hydrolase n=1 Tax=Rubritalea spongiae TaxID=430797 RepID=A0ABW5E4F7_9BACT
MTSYQDAHLHLQDPRLTHDLTGIIAEVKAQSINALVVNGTSPEDWNAVTELSETYPQLIIPSYGLHPWKTPFHLNAWKEQLTQLINENPKACIGECGLDKWMHNPNINAQCDAFHFQLGLAERYNRPISIHVLKAWAPLLDSLNSHKIPQRGFMLHGYGGSKETARQLVKLGAYFSFSGYFLQQRKQNVQEAFRYIPLDRILIETDAPDMCAPEQWITHPLTEKTNHPANLVATARGLASLLAMDFAELSNQLEANFTRFFLTE